MPSSMAGSSVRRGPPATPCMSPPPVAAANAAPALGAPFTAAACVGAGRAAVSVSAARLNAAACRLPQAQITLLPPHACCHCAADVGCRQVGARQEGCSGSTHTEMGPACERTSLARISFSFLMFASISASSAAAAAPPAGRGVRLSSQAKYCEFTRWAPRHEVGKLTGRAEPRLFGLYAGVPAPAAPFRRLGGAGCSAAAAAAPSSASGPGAAFSAASRWGGIGRPLKYNTCRWRAPARSASRGLCQR